MKKYLYFVILGLVSATLLVFSSCDCITGEGPVIEENRETENFTAIDLDISASVNLTKDTGCTIRIRAQESLLPHITTKVSGSKLEIDFETGCYKSSEPINVDISMKTITGLEVDGSGGFYGKDRFDVEKVDLDIDGSGEIDMQFFADRINADLSGSGDIKLRGTAKKVKVDINGSGDVDAKEMMAYRAYIDMNGTGNCSIFVHEYLDVSVSGTGDVYYGGSPEIKSHINGSGTLKKTK